MKTRTKIILTVCVIAAAVLLATYRNKPGPIFEEPPVYEITGTYMGTVQDNDRYFVFEETGRYCCYEPEETARIIDEGTYTRKDHNIFQLDSAMGRTHTVVCAKSGLYEFDTDSGAVYYLYRVSEEVYYVNLPA